MSRNQKHSSALTKDREDALTPLQREYQSGEPTHWGWRTVGGHRILVAKTKTYKIKGAVPNPWYWGGERLP